MLDAKRLLRANFDKKTRRALRADKWTRHSFGLDATTRVITQVDCMGAELIGLLGLD